MSEGRTISGGVYAIINTATREEIIGSTEDFHRRWRSYIYLLRRGIYTNHRLQSAWDTYGEQSFTFVPLLVLDEGNLTRSNLRQEEQRFFEERKPSYNISKNAFGGSAPTKTQWQHRIPPKYAFWGWQLVGPDGQTSFVYDLNGFADQEVLHRAGLYKLVRGKIGSHFGWRLVEDQEELYWDSLDTLIEMWEEDTAPC